MLLNSSKKVNLNMFSRVAAEGEKKIKYYILMVICMSSFAGKYSTLS